MRTLAVVARVAFCCSILGVFWGHNIAIEKMPTGNDPNIPIEIDISKAKPGTIAADLLVYEKDDINNASRQSNNTFLLRSRDIRRPGWIWDSVPVVIESHKLIFFTIPKVGCTVFKQLFRRMMGYENWRTKDPHDPYRNGLKYLDSYSVKKATLMMTSPEWTKAIFVRDPKERFLSAYLDKVKNNGGIYVKNHCCTDCVPETISAFLKLTKSCYDPHWAPQYKRMDDHLWELMDFVGAFENVHNDTQVLLERIGAWDEFGTGWGKDGDEEIFGATKTHHATGSTSRFNEFFTKSIEKAVEERYAADYRNERISKALKLDGKLD